MDVNLEYFNVPTGGEILDEFPKWISISQMELFSTAMQGFQKTDDCVKDHPSSNNRSPHKLPSLYKDTKTIRGQIF